MVEKKLSLAELAKILRQPVKDGVDIIRDGRAAIKNARDVLGELKGEGRIDEMPYIPPGSTPSDEGYLSFAGQSRENYCLECLNKHYSTALKYIEEAEDRSLKSGQGVQDKVRVALKEIAGSEDDFGLSDDPDFQRSLDKVKGVQRAIRKKIRAKNLTTINTSKEDLREIKNDLQGLLNETYKLAEEAGPEAGPIANACYQWGAKDVEKCEELMNMLAEGKIDNKERFERELGEQIGKEVELVKTERGSKIKVK